jgi:O-6-methylguanine DNA methyltransferase
MNMQAIDQPVSEDMQTLSMDEIGILLQKLNTSGPREHKLSPEASVITLCEIPSPLGVMLAGTTARGICLLEFNDPARIQTQLKRLATRFNARFEIGDHHHLTALKQQLKTYFECKLTGFTLPLDIPASEFQQQVWQALQKIPYGETRSYQQQAQLIDRPDAVRAVAKANGDNPVCIITPCHRVIGKNGRLTGYAGGLWRKQKLLELEKAMPQDELF